MGPAPTATSASPTGQLAAWATGRPAAALPPEVLHAAKRCLLDHLGVALAARDEPSTRLWVAHLASQGGHPQAGVYGRAARLNAVQASEANAYAAHVLDYDDTVATAVTTLHGSAPIWPVVLAVAEWRGASGRQALAAFAVGYEVALRVAEAAGPTHYHAGWHVTGTTGRFGAAAAAARLLGMDAGALAHAFGIAATQAGGLKAVYGSMCKAMHPARAAGDGLGAALLAASGFTSSAEVLEAPYGFLQLFSTAPEVERLTHRLGEQMGVTQDGFKPYPCGSLMHALIDGVLELREAHGLTPDQVDRIEVVAHPYVTSVTGKRAPESGLEGKFSAFHAAAVALIDGAAQVVQFTDERVRSADVRALRQRVSLDADEGLSKDQARVRIVLRDGSALERSVPHASGTPERPLTDAQIEAKALRLIGPVLGDAAAKRLVKLTWRLDERPDTGDLAVALRGPTADPDRHMGGGRDRIPRGN